MAVGEEVVDLVPVGRGVGLAFDLLAEDIAEGGRVAEDGSFFDGFGYSRWGCRGR